MSILKFWSQEEPLTERLARLALLLLLAAAAVKGIIIRFSAGYQGDELFYVREVVRLADQGFLSAVSDGISFLYTLSGYALSKLTGDILLGNRILSLISLAFVIHALLGITSVMKIRQSLRWLLILTILTFAFDPRRSPFLFGINDPMLFAVFFQSLYMLTKFVFTDNARHLIYAALLLGACFWIREISLMYLVALALPIATWCISAKGRGIVQRFITALLFLIMVASTAVLPHIPAITTQGTLGFEDKNYMGNWREREYLTQVRRISSGSVFAYQWIDWSEVEAYKEAGIQPPLPQNRLEILKQDPKMVADSFASNILIRCTYLFTLRNGLLFIVFLGAFLVLRRIRGTTGYQGWLLFSLFTLAYTLMLSAITIHRIEVRWLTPAIITMAVAAIILLDQSAQSGHKWYRPLVWGQYLFIGASLLFNLLR
ncbi:MAG: hypothetical protein R6V49_00885 [Bacteroidales bacterium]